MNELIEQYEAVPFSRHHGGALVYVLKDNNDYFVYILGRSFFFEQYRVVKRVHLESGLESLGNQSIGTVVRGSRFYICVNVTSEGKIDFFQSGVPVCSALVIIYLFYHHNGLHC